MAAENLKSTAVTNADATPVDMTGAYLQHGRLRESVAIVEAAGGDAGSTYRFCRIPSSARVSALFFACDDLGTGLTLDIGLYKTAADGGAVVDADFFASAVDVATAALAEANLLHESGVVNIDDSEKRIWEGSRPDRGSEDQLRHHRRFRFCGCDRHDEGSRPVRRRHLSN
jgi:hypothetical protein